MNCPFCNAVVYHLRQVDSGILAKHKSDPEMYHKDGKYYVNCPECNKSILLEQTATPSGAGARFSIAKNQLA